MENKYIISALLKAQAEIKRPEKTGDNPRFNSKYAKLDDIYSACQKTLNDNDLFLTHAVEVIEGKSFVVTKLYHTSGEKFETHFPMIIEQQTNQSIASARTYACRYGLCNLLAINFDKDDDGNAADDEESKGVSEFEEKIEDLLKDFPSLKERILKGYGKKSFREIDIKEHAVILKNAQKRIEDGKVA